MIFICKNIQLNFNKKNNGTLIQLPLPTNINKYIITNSINLKKDIDGINFINNGLLTLGIFFFLPCAPYGVIKILELISFPLMGSNIVIIGSSDIVGKPQAMLFINLGANITICNSKTVNLRYYTILADIIITATGKKKIIKKNMIKKGVIVFDIGANYKNNILCGDIDFCNDVQKVSYITPVPGGVGPLTVTMMMSNVLNSSKNFFL